jgi:hypothetical protein
MAAMRPSWKILEKVDPMVSFTSFLKQSTSEPIRRKFDEVIFKEDEAWERR